MNRPAPSGCPSRDLSVWGEAADAVLARVYQIKFFPDGFSGDRKTTRQRQIKRSFDTALKLNPPPYEWILVVPTNLTVRQREFVLGLASGDGPKVTIMDADDLDVLIATMPDIYNYLGRDQLENLMTKYKIETTALISGPDDLTGRLTNLRDVASSLNPHWGVDMTVAGDTISYGLRPKHPTAALDDPVRLELGFKFDSVDDVAFAPLRRSVEFGARGQVHVSGEYVSHAAVRSSHPLFNDEVSKTGLLHR